MPQFYTQELGGVAGNSGSAGTVDGLPVIKAQATVGMQARLRVSRGSYQLSPTAVGIADTLNVAILPAGALFQSGNMCAGVSLGTATLAIGIVGNNNKYRNAAVFTAVDTPTPFGIAAIMANQVPLAADERIIASPGVAGLPVTGAFLVVQMVYSNG